MKYSWSLISLLARCHTLVNPGDRKRSNAQCVLQFTAANHLRNVAESAELNFDFLKKFRVRLDFWQTASCDRDMKPRVIERWIGK